MKNLMIFLMITIVFNINAVWEKTNGPDGGVVNRIIRHGNYLFAATGGDLGENGSVYRSADNGDNWELVSYDFNINYGVMDVASNSNYLFAGTKGFGFYRSMDMGNSWENFNPVADLIQFDVKTLYADDNIVLAGTWMDGIYGSTDNGSTWSQFGTGLTVSSLRVLEIEQLNGEYYTVTAGGAYKLVNDVWTMITGINDNILTGIETDGTYIYISGNADTYRLDPQTMSVTLLGVFNTKWVYYDSGRLFTSTYQTIYYSDDSGDNWTTASFGELFPNLIMNTFYAESGFWITANSMFNLYKTEDDGMSWSKNSNGISTITVNDFATFNNKLYSVTEFADYGRIFVSDDDGMNWTITDSGTAAIGFFSVFGNDSFMLAASFGGGMYRSDDGMSWNLLPFNDHPASYGTQIVEHNGAIYTGALGFNIDVYKSTDNGMTFQPLNVPGQGDIYALQSWGNKIVYGRTDDVYYSEDDGMTWNALGNGFSSFPFIKHFAVYNNHIYASGTSLYMLDDNNDWQMIALPGSPLIQSIGEAGSKLLIGTREDGIYELDANGMITHSSMGIPVGSNGLYPKIMKFYHDDTYMYVSVEMFGVFRAPMQVTDVKDEDVALNSLNMRVYPNPARISGGSNGISVSFSLKESSDATVSIYNLKGQMVKTLHRGQLDKGSHVLTWDGNSNSGGRAATGVYLIKSSGSTANGTSKLILLK